VSGPVRLNLGSGNEPLEAHVNVDRRRVAGVAVVADVLALPFASATAHEVRASSLLEHFQDPYAVLDEVHRTLRADGRFVMRVPALWSWAAHLDRSHVFLADLRLWRDILSGYFERVRADPEGARYRDSRLLAGLCLVATHGLRLLEFADAWRFTCEGKKAQATRAYVPWWLEEKYGRPGAASGGAR
jgi:SAM-dependent methyltransferase